MTLDATMLRSMIQNRREQTRKFSRIEELYLKLTEDEQAECLSILYSSVNDPVKVVSMPTPEPETVKAQPLPVRSLNSVTWATVVYDILETHDRPMSAAEITEAAVAQYNKSKDHPNTYSNVHVSLALLVRAGKVERTGNARGTRYAIKKEGNAA